MNLVKMATYLFLCVFTASGVMAASPDARGTAMGGTYGLFAEGAEGMWWNPAVLGAPILGSAGLGVGLEGGNNAMSLTRISQVVSGSETAKKGAVEDVAKKGEWNAAIVGVGGLGASIKGFGIGVFPQVSLKANHVTPDTVRFALYYPKLPTDVSKGSYDYGGEVTRATFAEIGLGYSMGIPLVVPGFSLSAGAAIKYFKGIDYEYSDTKQKFSVGDAFAGISPTSYAVRKTSKNGSGIGVDLGAHAKIMGSIEGSLAVKNIGAKLTWKDVEVKTSYFDQSQGTPSFVSNAPVKGQEATQEIPTTVVVAAGGKIPFVGTGAAVEAEVGSKDSKASRVRLGLEQKLFAVFALRAGYETKAGASPAMVTAGVGLGALVASFDLGAGFALDGNGGMLAASGHFGF